MKQTDSGDGAPRETDSFVSSSGNVKFYGDVNVTKGTITVSANNDIEIAKEITASGDDTEGIVNLEAKTGKVLVQDITAGNNGKIAIKAIPGSGHMEVHSLSSHGENATINLESLAEGTPLSLAVVQDAGDMKAGISVQNHGQITGDFVLGKIDTSKSNQMAIEVGADSVFDAAYRSTLSGQEEQTAKPAEIHGDINVGGALTIRPYQDNVDNALDMNGVVKVADTGEANISFGKDSVFHGVMNAVKEGDRVKENALNITLAKDATLYLQKDDATPNRISKITSLPDGNGVVYLSDVESSATQGNTVNIGTLEGATHFHLNMNVDPSKSDLIHVDNGPADTQIITIDNAETFLPTMADDTEYRYAEVGNAKDNNFTQLDEGETMETGHAVYTKPSEELMTSQIRAKRSAASGDDILYP